MPKDMPPLDRIKFNLKGDTTIHFGYVQKYHQDAEKCWKDGIIIVSNPITGVLNTVELDTIEYEEQGYGWEETDPETYMPINNDYEKHINEAYKEHKRVSSEAGEGVVKGKIFAVGVGDGYAHYIVTKVNKKTVRVEWRGFSPDNWVDQTLGYGGTFPIPCISGHVLREEGLARLFGSKAKA
jgi:hypothetical protein